MKVVSQINRLWSSRWLAVALLAIAVLGFASLAEACPLCKQAADQTEQPSGDIAGGYFWSILFMMGMPFFLLGSFSGYMYLMVRKARRELAAKQSAAASNTATEPSTVSESRERESVEV